MISFLLLSLSAEDIMIEEEVQRVLLSKSKMPGDVIMHHAGWDCCECCCCWDVRWLVLPYYWCWDELWLRVMTESMAEFTIIAIVWELKIKNYCYFSWWLMNLNLRRTFTCWLRSARAEQRSAEQSTKMAIMAERIGWWLRLPWVLRGVVLLQFISIPLCMHNKGSSRSRDLSRDTIPA